MSSDRRKILSIQDEVQETESCLIGLNLHRKHAINKAVRKKCSSGTDLQELIELCSYCTDCRTDKFNFSCRARGWDKLQLNGAELCT